MANFSFKNVVVVLYCAAVSVYKFFFNLSFEMMRLCRYFFCWYLNCFFVYGPYICVHMIMFFLILFLGLMQVDAPTVLDLSPKHGKLIEWWFWYWFYHNGLVFSWMYFGRRKFWVIRLWRKWLQMLMYFCVSLVRWYQFLTLGVGKREKRLKRAVTLRVFLVRYLWPFAKVNGLLFLQKKNFLPQFWEFVFVLRSYLDFVIQNLRLELFIIKCFDFFQVYPVDTSEFIIFVSYFSFIF